MAEDAIELVRLRNDFYRDNYRRVLGLLLLAVVTVAILSSTLVYMLTHPPEPKYFATDSQGRLIEMPALNQPVLATSVVMQWAVQAATAAFTFDFQNYRAQLQAVNSYFTPEGWQNFVAALKSSNNLDAVITRKLTVSAVVTGAPVLTQEGLLEGRYAWSFRMPMVITYANEAQVSQQNVIATIVVVRVSTLLSPKGIAIAQMVVAQTGT